jgi:hypothetical protein
MQDAQQLTAEERAVMWERRARALTAALDEAMKTLDTPLTESALQAVEEIAGRHDDRLDCEWHLDREGWPEDGFRSYPTDDGGTISWCPECIASWPEEGAA